MRIIGIGRGARGLVLRAAEWPSTAGHRETQEGSLARYSSRITAKADPWRGNTIRMRDRPFTCARRPIERLAFSGGARRQLAYPKGDAFFAEYLEEALSWAILTGG
jgi:hypothetical protein